MITVPGALILRSGLIFQFSRLGFMLGAVAKVAGLGVVGGFVCSGTGTKKPKAGHEQRGLTTIRKGNGNANANVPSHMNKLRKKM